MSLYFNRYIPIYDGSTLIVEEPTSCVLNDVNDVSILKTWLKKHPITTLYFQNFFTQTLHANDLSFLSHRRLKTPLIDITFKGVFITANHMRHLPPSLESLSIGYPANLKDWQPKSLPHLKNVVIEGTYLSPSQHNIIKSLRNIEQASLQTISWISYQKLQSGEQTELTSHDFTCLTFIERDTTELQLQDYRELSLLHIERCTLSPSLNDQLLKLSSNIEDLSLLGTETQSIPLSLPEIFFRNLPHLKSFKTDIPCTINALTSLQNPFLIESVHFTSLRAQRLQELFLERLPNLKTLFILDDGLSFSSLEKIPAETQINTLIIFHNTTQRVTSISEILERDFTVCSQNTDYSVLKRKITP